MSEFENPQLSESSNGVTVDDIRELSGAATPHFALQVRNRLRRLIEPLDPGDPARQLGEIEIAKLEKLAVDGQRGSGDSDLAPLNQREN
ncbi:MAG: hypothetical protein QM648_10920 [Solirubrobacterales bacterium]